MIWGLNLPRTPRVTLACHEMPLLYFTYLIILVYFLFLLLILLYYYYYCAVTDFPLLTKIIFVYYCIPL